MKGAIKMNKLSAVMILGVFFGIAYYCWNDMYQSVFVETAKKEQRITQCAQDRMGKIEKSDPGYNLLFSVNHANCEFEMMK